MKPIDLYWHKYSHPYLKHLSSLFHQYFSGKMPEFKDNLPLFSADQAPPGSAKMSESHFHFFPIRVWLSLGCLFGYLHTGSLKFSLWPFYLFFDHVLKLQNIHIWKKNVTWYYTIFQKMWNHRGQCEVNFSRFDQEKL